MHHSKNKPKLTLVIPEPHVFTDYAPPPLDDDDKLKLERAKREVDRAILLNYAFVAMTSVAQRPLGWPRELVNADQLGSWLSLGVTVSVASASLPDYSVPPFHFAGPHEGDFVSVKDFVLLTRLGTGACSTVHLYRNISTGDYIALKYIMCDSLRQHELFANERAICASLHSDVICSYRGSGTDGDHAILAFEYMNGGSLLSLMRRAPIPLPLDVLAAIAFQALHGLHVLRTNDITHCDIKPGNILFDLDGAVKLGDFGISVRGSPPQGGTTGTLRYMSPERITSMTGFGPPSDVWAFGIVMYFISTGFFPFPPSEIEPLDLSIAIVDEE